MWNISVSLATKLIDTVTKKSNLVNLKRCTFEVVIMNNCRTLTHQLKVLSKIVLDGDHPLLTKSFARKNPTAAAILGGEEFIPKNNLLSIGKPHYFIGNLLGVDGLINYLNAGNHFYRTQHTRWNQNPFMDKDHLTFWEEKLKDAGITRKSTKKDAMHTLCSVFLEVIDELIDDGACSCSASVMTEKYAIVYEHLRSQIKNHREDDASHVVEEKDRAYRIAAFA